MIVIDYPRAGTHCMSGDNIQELHEFAKKLGLSGTQFIEHPGHPHYILQAGGMLVRKALTMGARGLSNNEYVHFILNNWRPKKFPTIREAEYKRITIPDDINKVL